jgi:transposase-like protein
MLRFCTGRPETLRGWVERVEIDAGQRPGVPSSVEARIKELERENAELRRANEILKTASAFSLRRSPTAECGDRRLHRRSPRPVRGRADLVRRDKPAWRRR